MRKCTNYIKKGGSNNMELLESDFAQIEHLNQVLYNNRSHDSWDCFDTAYLLEQYPEYGSYNSTTPANSTLTKKVVDLRYNSMIVNVKHESNRSIYNFEVRNSLWDGTYNITHSMNTELDKTKNFEEGEVEISTSNPSGNSITFTVYGSYRKKVRICFHMNLAKDGRDIKTTSIYMKHPFEFEHQYNESIKEEGFVYFETGNPVTGATITLKPCNKNGELVSEGIPSSTVQAKDVVNGKFVIEYGATTAPGDYYCLLTAAYESNSVSQVVHVKKIQKQEIKVEWHPLPKETGVEWGDENQYRDIIKGSIVNPDSEEIHHTGVLESELQRIKIMVRVKDEYGVVNSDEDCLKGMYATVTAKKITGGILTQVTCPFKKDHEGNYYVYPQLSYRGYYEDISTLQISIPSQNGYPAVTKERKVTHKWKIANNFNELKRELNNPCGSDWIFIKPIVYTVTETLNITPRTDGSRITIAGITGEGKCVLYGNDSIPLIDINNSNAATDNYFKVQLLGISLMHGRPAVKLTTGCRLLVDSCYFYSNNNSPVNHRGCSIFMPSDDKSKANSNLWKLEVRNTFFYNNRGNEIQSIGKTYLHNNLFRTDNASYLQQPEVKVVSVQSGEVTYKYNKSHIDAGRRPMVSNHSYAKALAYVGKNALFNGVGPSQLKRNNSLPLFGKPWYNEAYTYAIYYYPYGVRTTIVCSPEYGRERRATGHASSIENWVYYDGYYFLQYNGGRNKGNINEYSSNRAKHKWDVENEFKVPTSQGVFTPSSGLFKKGYDPRVSKNYSLNSELD